MESRFGTFSPVAKRRLSRSSIAVVGCGAIGSRTALSLARLGVKELRLIDWDVVEECNLETQAYTKKQVGTKKVEALAQLIGATGSPTLAVPIHSQLTKSSAAKLLAGADFAVDGLDNFQSRFALNAACRKLRLPLAFAACARADGMAALLVNKKNSPCLRCIFPKQPQDQDCSVVGLLPAAADFASGLQVALVASSLRPIQTEGLFYFNLENPMLERVSIRDNQKCNACRGIK
ncbi:ThiF family adenylyltransferase [Candidatus Micrarchaeota archaeon]|nr:ThiF family adenylyltransferase [Candidatus Micrarchaeota archaeon]